MPRPATKTEALELAHRYANQAFTLGQAPQANTAATLALYAATAALSLPADTVGVPLTAENFPDRIVPDGAYTTDAPIAGPKDNSDDTAGVTA